MDRYQSQADHHFETGTLQDLIRRQDGSSLSIQYYCKILGGAQMRKTLVNIG